DNLGTGGQITYSYDLAHKLTGETWKVNGVQKAQVTFHYDTRNRLDQINRYTTSGTVVTSFGLDADDRITTITHSIGLTTLSSFAYDYDAASRVKDSNGPEGVRTFTYDATDQLTAVVGSTTESYTYDLNGNRTSANGTNYGPVGAGNRLTYDGTFTYTYDDE